MAAHGNNSAACHQDDQEDHRRRIVGAVGAAIAGVATLAEAGPSRAGAVRSAVHANAGVDDALPVGTDVADCTVDADALCRTPAVV